jgi:hypothetical protein
MSFSWWSPLEKAPSADWVRTAFESRLGTPRVVVHAQPRSDSGGAPFILRDPNRDDDLSVTLGARPLSVSLPGLSAAGVEVSWSQEDGLRLRCFSQSSHDDYRLAAHAIHQLARGHRLRFEDDDGEQVDARSVDTIFDASLCELQHQAGRATIVERLRDKEDDSWVPIQSPVRPLFVSQRLLTWLDAEGLTISDQLIRLVELHHEPSVCPEKLTVALDEKTFVGELFPLGQRTLVAHAFSDDVVFVRSPGEAVRLVVPWHALVEVLENEVEWFDLRQFLAPAFNTDERAYCFRALERLAAAKYVVETS